MSCMVHSNPAVELFHWVDKSGRNLSISSSYSVLSTADSSVLTVSSVTHDDYANFTCVASNLVGSARFRLALLPPGIYFILL